MALMPAKLQDYLRRIVVKNGDVLEVSTNRFKKNEVTLRVELIGYRPITCTMTSKQTQRTINVLTEALNALAPQDTGEAA